MDFITNYTNHLKPLAKNTQAVYLSEFKAFVEYFKGEDYRYISRDKIIEYLARLYDLRYSPSKINQAINAIKFYREKILGQKRATYFLKRPRRAKFFPTIITAEQMQKVINTPKSLKHRALLFTIYDNGLRKNELVNLKLSDVITRCEHPHIVIRAAKHGGDRLLYISPKCVEILQQYYHRFKPQIYLFEGSVPGKPISETTIANALNHATKKCKLPHLRVHDLRHNFATHCLISGTDIYHLSKQLGHRRVETTQTYYAHLLPNQIRIHRPTEMRIISRKQNGLITNIAS